MWPITGWAKQHLLNTCWLISQWYYSNCHWNSATRNKHVHTPITPSTLQLPNMGKPPFHTVPDDAEHWSQPQMRTTNYNTEKYSILQAPLPQKEAVGYVIWLTPREKGVCQGCYAVSEMMDDERQQMRTHSGLSSQYIYYELQTIHKCSQLFTKYIGAAANGLCSFMDKLNIVWHNR